jgi:hypothetical protein
MTAGGDLSELRVVYRVRSLLDRGAIVRSEAAAVSGYSRSDESFLRASTRCLQGRPKGLLLKKRALAPDAISRIASGVLKSILLMASMACPSSQANRGYFFGGAPFATTRCWTSESCVMAITVNLVGLCYPFKHRGARRAAFSVGRLLARDPAALLRAAELATKPFRSPSASLSIGRRCVASPASTTVGNGQVKSVFDFTQFRLTIWGDSDEEVSDLRHPCSANGDAWITCSW